MIPQNFSAFKTPLQIQEFLDQIPYSIESQYRSPASVFRDRMAHCFDGALFAAAGLRHLGYPPLIINLFAVRDDDHLLALFKRGRLWGAIGKSNFSGLRFRDPVYRTLRELVMSYFEDFYNSAGEKTLRQYTRPLHLAQFDSIEWMTHDDRLDRIAERLDRMQRIPVLDRSSIRSLSPVDKRSYDAGMLGTDPAGLYKL